MKIAMITEAWDPIWGGGQVHIWELSKQLAKSKNCEVDIFTMNLSPLKGSQDFIEPRIRIIPVGYRRNFFSFFDRILWNIEVIWAIKKYHQAVPYSLLHAHSTLPGIPGRILAYILKIPIVYTVHGANALDLGRKNIFYFLEKFLFTQIRYDVEISVSENFLKYKNKNTPIIIPNGVDLQKFDDLRQKYSSSKKDSFRILFVGRLDEVKGIDILLKALSQITELLIQKKADIHIVGYGYQEEQLKKLCTFLQLDSYVTFTGKLTGEPLFAEYFGANIFILPSRSEGSPLTILEAWAAGAPVLVTNVGDNARLINPGITGFIVEAQNVEALRQGLIQALSSTELEEMGQAGLLKVQTGYNWINIAHHTYVTYQDAFK